MGVDKIPGAEEDKETEVLNQGRDASLLCPELADVLQHDFFNSCKQQQRCCLSLQE